MRGHEGGTERGHGKEFVFCTAFNIWHSDTSLKNWLMGEKDRGNGGERGVLSWGEGKMHQLEGKVQQEGDLR